MSIFNMPGLLIKVMRKRTIAETSMSSCLVFLTAFEEMCMYAGRWRKYWIWRLRCNFVLVCGNGFTDEDDSQTENEAETSQVT